MADKPSSSHKPPLPSSSDRPKLKFMPNSLKNKQKKIVQPKLEPSSEPSSNTSSDALDDKLRNLALLAEQRRQGAWRPSKVEKKINPMDDAFSSLDPRAVASSYAEPKIEEMDQDGKLNHSKDYEDPYDYSLDYPVDFPYRLPHTRSPDQLNEKEFGESNSHQEEKILTPAEELELLEDKNGEIYLFKFPSYLPMEKPSATSAKGNERVGSGSGLKNNNNGKKECCTLADLPAGFMGKLLVYKSGALKMKLGDVIFDVSPGIKRDLPQNLMAVNTETKQCCLLGEVKKTICVSPDVEKYCKHNPV